MPAYSREYYLKLRNDWMAAARRWRETKPPRSMRWKVREAVREARKANHRALGKDI